MYHINKTVDFLYFPYHKEHSIEELIHPLAYEYCHQDLCYENAMQASLISLFVKLTRIYSATHRDQVNNPESNHLLVQILAYINQNISTVSLQELSNRFQYSTSHLSRLIQKHTGKRFSEIVHHTKLETACALLKNETLSMQQIVEQIGFIDVSYFFHVFKKRYGLTPSSYRKNISNHTEALDETR